MERNDIISLGTIKESYTHEGKLCGVIEWNESGGEKMKELREQLGGDRVCFPGDREYDQFVGWIANLREPPFEVRVFDETGQSRVVSLVAKEVAKEVQEASLNPVSRESDMDNFQQNALIIGLGLLLAWVLINR